MSRTIVRNGTVVTASNTARADVLIENQKVVAVGRFVGDINADSEIDAAGKFVLPGGIDAHTHLDMPYRGVTVSADDFESGTIAAAHGGTTTIIDFASQDKGKPLQQALEAWQHKAEGKAAIDYAFHMIVTEVNDRVEQEIDDLVRGGVTSFKVFMAYRGALMLDDASISRLLTLSRENGALISVHAEDGDVIDQLVKAALAAGQTAPRYHALTRPASTEGDAVGRAIALARGAGARIYFVHVSTAQAVEAIRQGRRKGVNILAETCPQYLFMTASRYDEPGFDGAKYVISPPLRTEEDQDCLWDALEAGAMQTVATDHCPFRMADQKTLGIDDFTKIPNGAPGIEDRLTLLFDGGVRRGRISLNRFVDVTSTSPAKIFGLYPRKGTIAPGSDADIVVWDPQKRSTISAKTHHMKVDYNPYEGREVVGGVEKVILRGRVIIDRGQFLGSAGCGVFCPRSI